MPYLLLIAGVFILSITVLRLTKHSTKDSLRKGTFFTAAVITLILLFYLSATGRWPLALLLAAIAFWPFFGAAIRRFINGRNA